MIIKHILIASITAYQRLISPFLGSRCRFYPTCSEYAKQAISEYGLLKGLRCSIKRLSKCHPFSEGGIDMIKDCSHGPI